MKKIIICFLLFFTCALTVAPLNRVEALEVSHEIRLAGNYDNEQFDSNCKDFSNVLRMGGTIILIVKIALPLIIIVKASLSLMKVVTSGKQDELSKAASKAIYSIVASIIIFFIPTIIYTIFGFVDRFRENETEDSKICSACIFDPYGDLCSSSVSASTTGGE